jgi:4-aminobutyrate aminotransferase-like enzyme
MGIAVSRLKPHPTERVETRWRRIVTPIPVPESLPIIERLRAAEPRSMSGMPPVLWDQAEGFLVRDRFGNQWIDLTSSIIVANSGHSHPRILEAIRRAADHKLLTTYAFPQEPRLRLLEKLVALSPIEDSKAILFCAGTEATECAIMLMRRHGRKIHPEKVGILSFEAGYHGRTLAADSASGKPNPKEWIQRGRLNHYQIPYPFGLRWPWGDVRDDPSGERAFAQCIETLEQNGITPDKIAGFIGESIPGWATWPIPEGFARALADWARRHDILICFDEIQCGCGRSGKFFGFEHFGVTPDLVALGKGLSASLPVSAVLGSASVMDEPEPGEMSSTQGGNPVCAAAALANLEAFEAEGLVEASATTGEMVLKALRGLQQEYPTQVLSVHGPGLFISIHFQDPETGEPAIELADGIAIEAVRRGVLMFTTGRGMLKFTPPLSIDPEAAMEAVQVIRECLDIGLGN